jgi:RNase P subunit RPR2
MQGSAMPQYQPISATHLSNIERPHCPKCETRMLLSEVTPGPNGFDYRTFECQKCGHVHAVSVSHDPMQSDMRGWLAGELKPPT